MENIQILVCILIFKKIILTMEKIESKMKPLNYETFHIQK